MTGDWSGYSDLVQLSGPLDRDPKIGLMYEGGAVDARDEIRFARFDENYLGWRRSAGAATPDVSRPGGVAYVLGGASASRCAQRLDGVDDFVRVPFDRAQLPGSGDFTFTTSFSYGASKDPQALLWLGGMGTTAPQLWLRGEPASHRLIAMMTTAAGSKSVTTKQAYDDQQWHHLALERTGGRLEIWVDGVLAASGPDSPSSVSETVLFQLQLGGRLGGANHFAGSLDDARLYRQALTESEVDAVAAGRTVWPGPVVQLPLDRVR
ncbi:sialidase family protein [Amycolatopsis sp. NPDC023774]|uniref:sialidase family protein n=1 Tax=Amycolatopsis sp. NPDC023774 TaxID=3155015 RepID=UPI0034060E99